MPITVWRLNATTSSMSRQARWPAVHQVCRLIRTKNTSCSWLNADSTEQGSIRLWVQVQTAHKGISYLSSHKSARANAACICTGSPRPAGERRLKEGGRHPSGIGENRHAFRSFRGIKGESHERTCNPQAFRLIKHPDAPDHPQTVAFQRNRRCLNRHDLYATDGFASFQERPEHPCAHSGCLPSLPGSVRLNCAQSAPSR